MRELLDRSYFSLCKALGRVLRSGKYSATRIVDQDGELRVRKHRLFYAPPLLWLSGPLVRLLDTGVTILPQRDWEERERSVYQRIHGSSIRIDSDGTLVLPRLRGETLANVLEDPELEASTRQTAIQSAVVALAELHSVGITHGDAMAENVMVDIDRGVAHWFDFETVHEASRPLVWRRTDDVRALLATCLIRTAPEKLPGTLRLILDVYGDPQVARSLAASFSPVLRRSLPFHLAQAGLSYESHREIARLLNHRAG